MTVFLSDTNGPLSITNLVSHKIDIPPVPYYSTKALVPEIGNI